MYVLVMMFTLWPLVRQTILQIFSLFLLYFNRDANMSHKNHFLSAGYKQSNFAVFLIIIIIRSVTWVRAWNFSDLNWWNETTILYPVVKIMGFLWSDRRGRRGYIIYAGIRRTRASDNILISGLNDWIKSMKSYFNETCVKDIKYHENI